MVSVRRDSVAATLASYVLCGGDALLVLALVVSTSAGAQPASHTCASLSRQLRAGGFDVTPRAMQPVLQAAGMVGTSPIENIPEAGGTIGLARSLAPKRINADVVLMSGLTTLGAIVSYRSALTFADVTPIARLIGDYEVVIVPATSPFRSLLRSCDTEDHYF